MYRKTIIAAIVMILVAATAYAELFVVTAGGRRYKRTVVVSPVPGDPAASGAALLAAYNGVTGASASDPWLVKIEPGIFDVGATTLVTKPYVDLEGSGPEATTITSTQAIALEAGDAVEVRELGLSVQVVPDSFTAVRITDDASFYRVRIDVAASTSSFGFATGISISGAEAVLQDVIVVVDGIDGNTGISVGNSTLRMVNSVIETKKNSLDSKCVLCADSGSSAITMDNCSLKTNGAVYAYGVYTRNCVLNASNCRFDINGGSES